MSSIYEQLSLLVDLFTLCIRYADAPWVGLLTTFVDRLATIEQWCSAGADGHDSGALKKEDLPGPEFDISGQELDLWLPGELSAPLLLAYFVSGLLHLLLSLVLAYRCMTGPGANRGLCSALGRPSALPDVPILPVTAARVRNLDRGI